jgi:hypothetical protein
MKKRNRTTRLRLRGQTPTEGFEVNREEGAVIYANDPMLGDMHYERDGSPAFVFDMMEPERPKVDRAVLSFLKSEGPRAIPASPVRSPIQATAACRRRR